MKKLITILFLFTTAYGQVITVKVRGGGTDTSYLHSSIASKLDSAKFTTEVFDISIPHSRTGNTFYNVIDPFTNELVTFKKVTTWYDGTSMDDTKIDSIVYRKKGSEYFQRVFVNGITFPQTWGVKNDGITNNDASLKTLIAYCNNTGTTLFVPDGQYLATSNIWTDVTTGRGLNIIGQSQDKTRFMFTPSTDTALFKINGSQDRFENFMIYNNSGNHKGVGIKFGDSILNNNGGRSVVNNVTFSGLSHGIDAQQSILLTIQDCQTFGCDTGLFITSNSVNVLRHTSELDRVGALVSVSNRTGYGYGIAFNGGTFESDSVGIKVKKSFGGLNIQDVYFESNFRKHLAIAEDTLDEVASLTWSGGDFSSPGTISIGEGGTVRNYRQYGIIDHTTNPIKIGKYILKSDIDIPNVTPDINNNAHGIMAIAIDTANYSSSSPVEMSTLEDATLPSSPSTADVLLNGTGSLVAYVTNGTMVRDTIHKAIGTQSLLFVPIHGTAITSTYSSIPVIGFRIGKSMINGRYGGAKMMVYVDSTDELLFELRAKVTNLFGNTHVTGTAQRFFRISGTANGYVKKWLTIYLPYDTIQLYNLGIGALGTSGGPHIDSIEFRVVTNYVSGTSAVSDSNYKAKINAIEVYNTQFPGGNFMEWHKSQLHPYRLVVNEIKMPTLSTASPSTFDNVVINNTSGVLQRASAAGFQPLITWGSGLTYTGTTATNDVTTGKNVLTQSWIGSTQNNGNVIISANSNSLTGQIFLGSDAIVSYNVSSHWLSGLSLLSTSALFAPSGLLTITHRGNIATGVRFANNDITTSTSGQSQAILLNDNFTTPSGTATRDVINATYTINQSVGGSGITSFLHNQVNTIGAADYRFIYDETDSGTSYYQKNAGVLNSFFGQMGIGKAATTTSYLSLAASTTGLSSLNIASGAAPSSPSNGDVWQASNHLSTRLNGVTYQLDQQLNGNTFTSGSSTYTGTAGQTYTFPTTTAAIARTDAAQTFTGNQTLSNALLMGGGIVASTSAALNINHRQDIATGISFGPNGNTVLTSGNRNTIQVADNIFPTSGTLTYNSIQLSPSINQTGGASGITRGLFFAPTLTAAANWRDIQWDNTTGYGLYGNGSADNYLNGNTGIGAVPVTDKLEVTGNIAIMGTGKLKIQTGTNASVGTGTLVAGTVTINTTAVTASSIIIITAQETGTYNGRLRVSARVAGTSFTVLSSDGADTVVFGYQIIN